MNNAAYTHSWRVSVVLLVLKGAKMSKNYRYSINLNHCPVPHLQFSTIKKTHVCYKPRFSKFFSLVGEIQPRVNFLRLKTPMGHCIKFINEYFSL